jgi:hypothetical protein
MKLDPPTIEGGASPREVTVTIGARDDLSGVSFLREGADPGPFIGAGVRIASPSGKQTLTADRGTNPMISDKWSLISGTPQDGLWQAKLILPKSAEPGTWKVQELCLRDAARNSRCYDSAEASALGVPDLTVVSATTSSR